MQTYNCLASIMKSDASRILIMSSIYFTVNYPKNPVFSVSKRGIVSLFTGEK